MTRVIRIGAWVVLAAATLVAGLLTRFAGQIAFVAELPYLSSIFVATGLAIAVAVRAHGIERRFWSLLAAASGMVFVSDTYWSAYTYYVDVRGPRLPSWIELLQVGAACAFIALVVTMTDYGADPFPSRLRLYTDVAASFVLAFVIVYFTVTRPLFAATPGAEQSDAVIAAVYPCFGLVMVFGILLVMGRGPAGWRIWELLIVAGVGIFAVGMITWPWWYADFLVHPRPGGTFVTIATLGNGLMGVAMIYRLTGTGPVPIESPRRFPRFRSGWAAAIYSGAIAGVAIVLGALSFSMTAGFEQHVLLNSAATLSLLLAARSVLMALETAVDRRRTVVDPATGLKNHSSMADALTSSISASGGRDVSIVAFEVDGFGDMYRMHGPAVADDVLRRIASILAEEGAPMSSQAFRSAAEGFAVILPDCPASEALRFADKVAATVDRTVKIGVFPVSVSAGVASYPQHAGSAQALFMAAEAAANRAESHTASVARLYDPMTVGVEDPNIRLESLRKRAHVSAVRALAAAVEARQPEEPGHARIVADLAVRLGQVLGLDEDRLRSLELAALVHDVGNVGIADRVLLKETALSAEEVGAVRAHSELGERVLLAAGLSEIARWIRAHHERWDGCGYPDGLAGDAIPIEARIIFVAGSFEAMTAHRTWRDPMSVDEAISELQLCAGTQFDPRLVEVFARLVRSMQTAPAPVALDALGVGG